MHHYDIAAKVLIDICRDEILRRFLHLDVNHSSLIENLPQETVSVKRSDFPMKVIDAEGRQTLVLLEIQTEWNDRVPLNLLDYRIRHILSSGLPTISAVLLLKPSQRATDRYTDEELDFRYRLIRLYEMDAREAVEQWPTCLLPFVPLMKNGVEAIREAEQSIYDAPMPSGRKADMLTSMTILSGLVSDRLPFEILSRRRDMMIESAGYELIKQEGFQQGVQQGIQQGVQQGIQQGVQQGIQQGVQQGQLATSREYLVEILIERFNIVPQHIFDVINRLENLSTLKMLRKSALRASSVEMFENDMRQIIQ